MRGAEGVQQFSSRLSKAGWRTILSPLEKERGQKRQMWFAQQNAVANPSNGALAWASRGALAVESTLDSRPKRICRRSVEGCAAKTAVLARKAAPRRPKKLPRRPNVPPNRPSSAQGAPEMALRGFVDSFRPRQTGKENLKTAKQTPKTLPTAPNGLGGPQEASKRPREVHDSSP